MALADTFVKNVKPKGTPAGEKHSDGQALHLHVKEVGKYWRMSYSLLHDPVSSPLEATDDRPKRKKPLSEPRGF